MLDPGRLLLLRSVVDAGSVTGGARTLGYSPSAVSQQIAALEREIGMPVLERHARGVRPTTVGAALADSGRRLAALLDAAQGEVDEVRRGHRGHLVVASFPTATVALFAPAALALRSSHPDLELTLHELEPVQSLPLVAARALDVALVFDYPALAVAPPAGVVLETLLEDLLVVVVPAGHRLARQPEVLLHELRDEPWVHGHDWGPPTRLLNAVCAAAGFTPRAGFESDSYEVQVAMVASGLGVALVPRLALDRGRHDVRALPVLVPGAVRRVTLATPRGARNPATAHLAAALRAAAAPRARGGASSSS